MMIDLFEKIAAGVCALIILCVTALYVLGGTPSTMPREFVQAVRPVEMTRVVQSSPQVAKRPGMAPILSKAKSDDAQSAEIAKKLEMQGVKSARRGPLQKMALPVPPSTFEFAQSEANWLPELKKYRSTVLTSPQGETRLAIDGVEENTMLSKLGFESGDVIELVDGEIIEFNEQSAMRYRSMFKDKLSRMREGEAISVTITRDRQPVQLYFSLANR